MKSEFNGTPGPWISRTEFGIDIIRDHDSAFGICNIGYPKELEDAEYPIDEAKANAKLIASAPELLQALKDGIELMKYLINVTPTGKVRNAMCDFNIIAQSAINKALGN